MDATKGITVKIGVGLHGQAKTEQERLEMTMNQYITMILEEHFNRKGGISMTGTRTMAFQVDEDLFARLKAHLARTGLTQKAFVVGLVEQALNEAEAALQTEQEEAQSYYAQAEDTDGAFEQEEGSMPEPEDGDAEGRWEAGDPDPDSGEDQDEATSCGDQEPEDGDGDEDTGGQYEEPEDDDAC